MFFYIAIIGAFMMMLSRIQFKFISERGYINSDKPAIIEKKRNNFLIKLKNTPLYGLFYSIDIARNNMRIGTILAMAGIAGMLVSTVIKIGLFIAIVAMIIYFLTKFVKNKNK